MDFSFLTCKIKITKRSVLNYKSPCLSNHMSVCIKKLTSLYLDESYS